jgi:hypothetical protein
MVRVVELLVRVVVHFMRTSEAIQTFDARKVKHAPYSGSALYSFVVLATRCAMSCCGQPPAND